MNYFSAGKHKQKGKSYSRVDGYAGGNDKREILISRKFPGNVGKENQGELEIITTHLRGRISRGSILRTRGIWFLNHGQRVC